MQTTPWDFVKPFDNVILIPQSREKNLGSNLYRITNGNRQRCFSRLRDQHDSDIYETNSNVSRKFPAMRIAQRDNRTYRELHLQAAWKTSTDRLP